MTLFFDVLAIVSLIAAVTNVVLLVYQNSQRRKEIVVIDAAIKVVSADSKSSEENLRKEIASEIASIRDHATATRAFAEAKALRNTVVVSVADHAQIVKDHKG